MVRLNFHSLVMDLILENYQSSDDEIEIIEPVPERVPELVVIEDDEEIEIIEPAPQREEQPVAFENLTRREQKELFLQVINQFPPVNTETYICNWCPSRLRKGSVIRHVREQHPDQIGPHWRNLCQFSTKSLRPILKDLSTEVIEDNRVTVYADISWGGSRKKRHPLADVIGSHSVRKGLNEFRDRGTRRLRMLTISDEVTNMHNLWRAGKDQAGRYGLAMPPAMDSACPICLTEGPNTNKSVFFHWNYPNNALHLFCTHCIQQSITLGNSRCPSCNEAGYPIRLYHQK